MDIDEVGDIPPEDWLTPRQVATHFPGATVRSILNWIHAGKFPGSKKLPNKRWVIPMSDVTRLLVEMEKM